VPTSSAASNNYVATGINHYDPREDLQRFDYYQTSNTRWNFRRVYGRRIPPM
jgi:hypothetical protein